MPSDIQDVQNKIINVADAKLALIRLGLPEFKHTIKQLEFYHRELLGTLKNLENSERSEEST